MSQRVNPELKQELLKYGVKDWNECFHCGNCTATCPLTEDNSLFPRRVIRQAQMGIKNSLESNIDPWMCYYCGDCSKTCPRDANPGELMMSLRRYLTTIYDWTGISRLVSTSKIFEIIAILGIAIVVLVLYILFTFYPSGDTSQWIGSDGGALINKMAPWKRIHLGDWLMAGVLAFILITNIFNMWYKTILKDKSLKVGIIDYFKGIFDLPIHLFTQKRFAKCDKNSRNYWYIHLFLMLSYIMLFTIIVFFLEFFQTDIIHPIWHPQRLLGYIATIGLFVGIIYFYNNRRTKIKENGKHSHYTDWTFLVLLFLTTLTGILLHIFRISGMPQLTYFTYLIHLMVLVPMLTIEVPFSKWSHLAYRPFAVYFSGVINSVRKKQSKKNN